MLSESKYLPFQPGSRSMVFNSLVSMKGIFLSPRLRPIPILTACLSKSYGTNGDWFTVHFPIIILDYPIFRANRVILVGLVVQKYGGTSVGSIERIKAVADRVVRAHDGGNHIVVVVSAMAGETNRLFKLASELCESPSARETDVLVATGEQVSAALLAIRLQSMGHPTDSFLAFQMNLTTDSNHR